MNGLNGKVALVTGSARGIGKGCALELARRGADVVINDRDHLDLAEEVAAEVRGMGRRAVVIPSDVSNRAACAALVDRAVAEFGRLDIVVANAAFSIRKPFLELEEADAVDTFAGTFWSAFHTSQFAARRLAQQGGGGSMIFISSVLALLPFPTSSMYNAAKAAINQMARTMAAELAPLRIRVNVVEPGWIDTPGERKFATEEEIRAAGALQPLGRLGSGEDIAKGVAYLASDDAAYVTGSILRIDGGYVVARSK
jgi:glucose 1-dehydrogenase